MFVPYQQGIQVQKHLSLPEQFKEGKITLQLSLEI